jgi:hypothetical protein
MLFVYEDLPKHYKETIAKGERPAAIRRLEGRELGGYKRILPENLQ